MTTRTGLKVTDEYSRAGGALECGGMTPPWCFGCRSATPRDRAARSRACSAAGFTLLEVLVTLAVLAVGTALTLSLISGSLANIRKVQIRNRTIQHAETVMELSLLDDAIRRPTTLHGDFEDGTRWDVVVNDVEMPPMRPDAPLTAQKVELPVKVMSYTVEVFSPNATDPDMRLQTLKLVSTQEQPTLTRMPGAVR